MRGNVRSPGSRLPMLWALALALCASPAALAQPPSTPTQTASGPAVDGTALYDVEMVVFRASQVGPPEDWEVAPPGRGFGASTGRPPQPPEVVRILPSSDYRLDGVVRRLRVSGVWYPVAHAAWVQTAPAWGTHLGVPLSAVDVNVTGLTGNVYLERAPLFLHLGFDLSLQGGGATYTIDEMHNVRQNEKQYFDHPAFGIIAVVRPLKRGD